MVKESDVPVLNQLIGALEESYNKMKRYYDNKDSEKFNEIKRDFIKTQRQILEIVGQQSIK